MYRSKYDSELEELNLELIRMGAMAEQTIENAMRALDGCDVNLAKRVIEEDDAVDNMARQIESRSLKLIMRQQPVAKDLRSVSAALKMITDLERICDQAADIAEITIMLCGIENIVQPANIRKMGVLAVEMVRLAVDSFVKNSTEIAAQVIRMDDKQDALFDMVKNELIDIVLADRKQVDRAVDFLLIAKYLERISDHAENIADWTGFAVTGVHKKERIL